MLALTGTDPDRFAEEKRRGLTIDLGLRLDHAALGRRRRLRRRPRPRAVPQEHAGRRRRRRRRASSSSRPPKGGSRSPRSTCASSSCSASRHGIVALTKVDLVDAELADDLARSTSPTTWPARSSRARRSSPWRRRRASGWTRCGPALDAPASRPRRRPPTADRAPPVGRPGVRRQGGGHGRHGHAHRRSARRGRRAGRGPVGAAGAGPGHPDAGSGRRTHRPGQPGGVEPGGIDHDQVTSGRRRRARRAGGIRPPSSTPRSGCSARSTTTSPGGAPTWPTSARASTPPGPRARRERIRPGADGLVRLRLPAPLPLLPGDRFVLRESGRDETVGGGEVLDVAPVLAGVEGPARPFGRPGDRRAGLGRRRPARRAHRRAPGARSGSVGRRRPARSTPWWRRWPSGSMARAPSGWTWPRSTSGRGWRWRWCRAWPSTPGGPGRRRPRIRWRRTPALAALEAGGCAPPAVALDPTERRELVRRGLVVELDGLLFAPSAVDQAARAAARLLAAPPAAGEDGFTVGSSATRWGRPASTRCPCWRSSTGGA